MREWVQINCGASLDYAACQAVFEESIQHVAAQNEYPLSSHFFGTPAGRLHYVDKGSGSPVVMVHGNCTWSFLYRNTIKRLQSQHRCIAMDHIGFSLSD